MSARLLSPALLALLLTGCFGGANRVAPGDVRAAVVHMDVALDRAIDAHEEGHPEAAAEAWREAHINWEQTLAPGLEPQVGRLEIVALELHLARIRSELHSPDGDPKSKVDAFRGALESPLRSLPPAPGG